MNVAKDALGPSILLTGATGFVGSHFLLAVVKAFPACKIFVVVRGKTEQIRHDKLVNALHAANSSYAEPLELADIDDRVVLVQGDIEQDNFGMSEVDMQMVAQEQPQIWHFAASLNYEESQRDSIASKNVSGTRHSVELAQKLNASLFAYISTAYSCGFVPGDIPEGLHNQDRVFSNYYEESKCAAEWIVSDYCRELKIPFTILRPSIVIGNSQSYAPAGSETGFYGMIIHLLQLKEVIANTRSEVRIFGDRVGKINLVPVDQLMTDILFLMQNDRLGKGDIYHLCSDENPYLADVFDAIFEGIEVSNLRFTAKDEKYSSIEKLVLKRTQFHSSYLASTKNFARRLRAELGERVVSLADVRAYVRESVKRFRIKPECRLRRSTVVTSDQVALNAYASFASPDGNKPYVIVINAHGMPVDFVLPLSSDLSDSYNVVTWEIRGIPSDVDNPAIKDFSIERNVADLVEVAQYYGIQEFHLIGWCTGARVALSAAAALPTPVRSLVLMNGAFFDSGVRFTPFEKANLKIMPLISRKPEMAPLVCESMYKRRSSLSEKLSFNGNISANLVSGVSGDIAHMAGYPFRNFRYLIKYSQLINEIISKPVTTELVKKLSQPVLIASGQQDSTSSPDHSALLHRRIDGSSLLCPENADHYAFYRDETYRRQILSFVNAH